MNGSPLALYAAALIGAAALAWWPWRAVAGGALARTGLVARAVAILALLLLLLDPGIRAGVRNARPLVLLDNSVSMHAAVGTADSATTLGATLGEVVRFGELAPGEPGGTTLLAEPLAAAVGAGRPIVILTDGEVADAGAIPADLLAQADIRTLPRTISPNVAIVDVRMPARLAAGDSLRVEIDLRAFGSWQDSVQVEVRDQEITLFRATVALDSSRRSATVSLTGILPPTLTGLRWIEIVRSGVADSEPADDRRWRALRVTPTPGIVVIAAAPDWDARALYATLRGVAESAVRGYVQLRPGAWFRMDDLRPVLSAEVNAAARAADLLAVRGDTTPWRSAGRARLFWPVGRDAGDWYLTVAGASPLADAFVSIDADSLPPLPAVNPVPAGDWVALEARRDRRGAAVPVIAGRIVGGRTVLIGASGFHAWSFQGGQAEQAWRTMLGRATEWLLAAPAADSTSVRPVSAVVQRGRPMRFRRGQGSEPLEVRFQQGDQVRTDTLRFDAEGFAEVALSPGRWQWVAAGNVGGDVMVEDYSDELLPGRVTLESRPSEITPTPRRRSLRELLPFFALAVAGFSIEWGIRKKLGLR